MAHPMLGKGRDSYDSGHSLMKTVRPLAWPTSVTATMVIATLAGCAGSPACVTYCETADGKITMVNLYPCRCKCKD